MLKTAILTSSLLLFSACLEQVDRIGTSSSSGSIVRTQDAGAPGDSSALPAHTRRRMISALQGPAVPNPTSINAPTVNGFDGMRLPSPGSNFSIGLQIEAGETLSLVRAKVRPGVGSKVRTDVYAFNPDSNGGGGSIALLGELDSSGPGGSVNQDIDIPMSWSVPAGEVRFVTVNFRQVVDVSDSFVTGIEVTSSTVD